MLTTERIMELEQQSYVDGRRPVHREDCWGDEKITYEQTKYFNMFMFARAIEAEVRKEDTELIAGLKEILGQAIACHDEHECPAIAVSQQGAVYAELPKRRRAFLCTKCGSRECEPGTIEQAYPPCKCGYLGFAQDLDFTVEDMRAYADATHALRTQQPAPAGEYPALPARTVDELGDYQRQAAIAAFRTGHGHEPDFGFAPDRAWIEGAAYIDAAIDAARKQRGKT